jgi:hypothetical protein
MTTIVCGICFLPEIVKSNPLIAVFGASTLLSLMGILAFFHNRLVMSIYYSRHLENLFNLLSDNL